MVRISQDFFFLIPFELDNPCNTASYHSGRIRFRDAGHPAMMEKSLFDQNITGLRTSVCDDTPGKVIA